MIPSLGAYYRPGRLEEALTLLRDEPRARVLAGGTDVLLETHPQHALVDVTRLGLDSIHREDDDLVLGATARVEDVLRNDLVRAWADGVLVGACLNFGTLQVRNMATVGGNVAHALPAADLVPALQVLDASVGLTRLDARGDVRTRRVPLSGFATAPFETQLEAGELIVDVRVPAGTRRWRAHFRKIGRVLKDLAQVNCAVALSLQDGRVDAARIAVGAVHPVVTRVETAEAELVGGEPGSAAWPQRTARAIDALRTFIRPISDVRASADWRRHVCGVLVQRSLDLAVDARWAGRVPRYEDGPLYRVGVEAGGSA